MLPNGESELIQLEEFGFPSLSKLLEGLLHVTLCLCIPAYLTEEKVPEVIKYHALMTHKDSLLFIEPVFTRKYFNPSGLLILGALP